MKLLPGVEVLCVKITIAGHSSSLVRRVTQINDGVYLPNLRELEVAFRRGQDEDEEDPMIATIREELMTATTRLLETQSEKSRLISMICEDVPLEPTMVRISMSFK